MTRTAAPAGAQAFVPESSGIRALRAAADTCRGCELYLDATQTVFGEGRLTARLVLIGEQPGDIEDRRGHVFVGPAGHLLDRALADAGIDRADAYLTNAVKHFRWKPAEDSKRRLHETPAARHITACRPWLAAELGAVRPAVVVAMGAVASTSLFGTGFRLSAHRGQTLSWPPVSGPFAADTTPIDAVLTTIHPSAVLRALPRSREETYRGLVEDLALAARLAR